MDGLADADPGPAADPAAEHRQGSQDRRRSRSSPASAPWPRCWPPRWPARCPTGPRMPTASRPAARPAAPLDAAHGPARRDQHAGARAPADGGGRGGVVGPVQRIPERRVREPQCRDPRSRAGPPAGHRGRLGRHAAGPRPGRRHGPGGASARQQRHQRLLHHGRAVLPAGDPVRVPDPGSPARPRAREPFSWRQLARAYWISPKEYPDFAWAWITRFLASLAIAMGTLYLLYFLRDKVQAVPRTLTSRRRPAC